MSERCRWRRPGRRGDPGLGRLNRDAVTATIVVEMLAQGVLFNSRGAYGLPVSRSMVRRAFRALLGAGVITRTRARTKFILTDEFFEAMRQEITKGMPRGTYVHYPDLSVFDVCGIGDWSAEELEAYVEKLRQRWVLRTGVL